ncbi:hypothetical protein QM012_005823 [Aureobasidium pullulans]|uniref:F-box domain-containing protein n=1 Tax=Aureobasidium pullulans TaxID=5580 RepID=A0ABR0TSH7_AURPU
MDTLPLELKQRVCSYLTTKDLKSLRLASKVYSVAACRYLLPRIFLFNHPDSCQEVQDIANHSDLNQSVTTLIVDTSCLRSLLKYDSWVREFVEVESDKTQQSERSSSASSLDARTQRILHRNNLRERWASYCASQKDCLRNSILSSIALAFLRCPRLKNLVVECHINQEFRVRSSFGMLKKREQFYRSVASSNAQRSSSKYDWSWESMQFDIWDVLKPVHDAARSLNSLVLLDADLTCPLDWTPPATSIFRSLKHLRQINCPTNFLTHIVASAPGLKSFGTFDRWHLRRYPSVPSLISGPLLPKLRACSFTCVAEGEDLIQFLLRHAHTLQQLRIDNTLGPLSDWSRFVTSVRGKLPNLRRVDLKHLATFTAGWGLGPYFTEYDILQNHKHKLELSLTGIEDGLWEDYEQMFFPEKIEL